MQRDVAVPAPAVGGFPVVPPLLVLGNAGKPRKSGETIPRIAVRIVDDRGEAVARAVGKFKTRVADMIIQYAMA